MSWLEVSLIVSCFVSLIFISLTKIVPAFSKTDCYVFLCEFSNANVWVDEVEFEVKAGAGLGVHDTHRPSGWEVCAGDPDGASCLRDILPNKFSEECISFAIELGFGICCYCHFLISTSCSFSFSTTFICPSTSMSGVSSNYPLSEDKSI